MTEEGQVAASGELRRVRALTVGEQETVRRAADTMDALERRVREAEAALAEARTILAGTDIGSLPNDMTLADIARARMADHAHAWERVERGDARAASLEIDLATAQRQLREMGEALRLAERTIDKDSGGTAIELKRIRAALASQPAK